MPAPIYLSINEFPGDGVTKQHEISFAGGYISREHVRAYTENADGVILEVIPNSEFVWINDSTVLLPHAGPVAGKTRIYRDTPKDFPLVVFSTGSRITEKNLDLITKQTVFAAAEAMDAGAYATAYDILGAAGAALAAAQDAIISTNLARDDANTYASQSNIARAASVVARLAAEDARDSASTWAAASEASALGASTAVGVATTARDAAQTAAGAASGSATASATSASGSATSATAAANSASQALGYRNTAQSAAGTATTQAGVATAKASEAAASALAAAAFDPSTYLRKDGSVALTGHLEAVANATGAQVPRASEAAPVGEITWHATASAPPGRLKANGAAVSRATYAALFAAIGTVYGAGNGSTTFNLPDLRGEFVRGLDDGRGVDASRSLGSEQTDALQGHGHNIINTQPGNYRTLNIGAAGGVGNGTSFTTNDPATHLRAESPASLSGYGTLRLAAETRPRNIALLACIRY